MPKSLSSYAGLLTEKQNPRTQTIDLASTPEILRKIQREDLTVAWSVGKVNRALARAADCIVERLKNGGRLFFMGAGTSGRLGVMEAAECPPTFDTPPGLIQALMAGGKRAVFRSREGAEDREGEARRQVSSRLKRGDILVGIAASGATPYVLAGLQSARRKGCPTILITCSPPRNPRRLAELVIAPRTGPEVIAGSTRMKAGTATKMILNRLTTAAMIRLGKVYRNTMVDLQPKSRKLRARAIRLIQLLGKVRSEKLAQNYLRKARGKTKLAILMARKNLDYAAARKKLQSVKGFLRLALR